MEPVFWVLIHLAGCPHFAWPRVLPDVHTHLLAKMDFSIRFSGRLAGPIIGWFSLPSLTPKECLGGLLDSLPPTPHPKNVFFLSFTQAEFCSCHYLYFKIKQETSSSCSPWGQDISCLQVILTPSQFMMSAGTWWCHVSSRGGRNLLF